VPVIVSTGETRALAKPKLVGEVKLAFASNGSAVDAVTPAPAGRALLSPDGVQAGTASLGAFRVRGLRHIVLADGVVAVAASSAVSAAPGTVTVPLAVRYVLGAATDSGAADALVGVSNVTITCGPPPAFWNTSAGTSAQRLYPQVALQPAAASPTPSPSPAAGASPSAAPAAATWRSTDVQGLGNSVSGEVFSLKLTVLAHNVSLAELAAVDGVHALSSGVADALAVGRTQVSMLNATDAGADAAGKPRTFVFLVLQTDRGTISTPHGTLVIDLPPAAQMTVMVNVRRRADLPAASSLRSALADVARVIADTVQRGTGIGCRATTTTTGMWQ
jgi:hypothetical protein